jgi:hypothetical protein
LYRAQERDETLVRRGLNGSASAPEWPQIKAMARTEKAGLTFAGAVRIRSDHHAGPTWAAKGENKSGVNAAVFIAFLQRLIAGARGVIFLIVDRGPAYAAKKTRAFGERVKGSLRLFYRSPYSPDRNPDALVRKHRKADTEQR